MLTKRDSMLTITALFLTLLALSLLFSSVYAQEVKRGGVVRVAEAWTPNTLDIHKASMRFAVLGAVYDYLIEARIDEDTGSLLLEPALATSWYEENENRRIVFELREDVKFHDGSSFNAEIAKWNLDRLRTHPESHIRAEFEVVTDIEVLSPYSIALNLEYPSKKLYYDLSSAILRAGMVSKAFHDTYGEDELYRQGAGSGPFIVKQWIVDDRVVLERNPSYWKVGADGKSLPYLDSLEIYYRPDVSQSIIDLRAGMLDVVEEPPARDTMLIEDHPNLKIVNLPPAERARPALGLNARLGPFVDENLREAALLALDRERISDIMGFGVSRPHQYPYITTGQIGWDPDYWPDYSYDPERAKELVKISYPNGVDVELFFIEREPDSTIGEMIKSMWDAVGIRTTLGGRERLGWIDSMREDVYEAAMWSAPTRPGTAIDQYIITGSGSNWGNYSNIEVDRLFREYGQISDREKSHEIMREALKMVWEDKELASAYTIAYSAAAIKEVIGLRTFWDALDLNEVWLDK